MHWPYSLLFRAPKSAPAPMRYKQSILSVIECRNGCGERPRRSRMTVATFGSISRNRKRRTRGLPSSPRSETGYRGFTFSPRYSVTGIVQRQDCHNRVRIPLIGRPVVMAVLVVGASRTGQLIVVRS